MIEIGLIATIIDVGVATVLTTAIICIILWQCRNLIITRLKNAVAHENETKIEGLRTELRKSEESYKADLIPKAPQIETLRNAASSGNANRQAILYKRQIEAVERLWEAVVSISPARALSGLISKLKVDAPANKASVNFQVKEAFKMIGETFNANKSTCAEVSKIRPFVSKPAWAYYSAYQVIIGYAVSQCKFIENGLAENFFDVESIKELIKKALPHHEPLLEKSGPKAFHCLLEELESKLLAEIDLILSGKESDQKSIERAEDILREAQAIRVN
ncbi:MAG: hypothetical protein FVQ82_14080 [Planctomycetes bacterium]|nr:hypothetical protein [Planctomycetota bacterium]